jgi:Na+/melibiose symporter-like transporter
LEAGRAGTAALLATMAFLLFSTAGSFQWVILATSIITFLCGWLVWIFIPKRLSERSGVPVSKVTHDIRRLLRMRSTWLLIVIITCAYIGYRVTDDFSLFAREVLGFSEVRAAGTGTAALWLRVLVAIIAGATADRFMRINVIVVGFILTLIGGLLIGFEVFEGVTGLLLLNLAVTAIGIYGVRALYFAVMREAGFPVGLTGTAVGIVSFAGFTPDIFFGPWMGHLLDRSPGPTGHADLFLLLSAFSLLGLVAALMFRKYAAS